MGKDCILGLGEMLKLKDNSTGKNCVGRIPYESELTAEVAEMPKGSYIVTVKTLTGKSIEIEVNT